MATVNKKVCMLGDFAVGKTSLVKRFVFDRFDDKYISSIGVKVSRKSMVIPRDAESVMLNMMLWDLAGSEEFSQVRASYLRGSSGAILVCDLTRPETLPNVTQYAHNLVTVSPSPSLVVVANKVDLQRSDSVTERKLAEIASQLNAPYFMTSAKTGQAVEAMFRALGQRLL